ncbi:MAG: hypothetical protein QOJ50_3774 [Cryptosporangiaceae bacterium]|nr:hypothetical protein [Cryptosporangiaceae bacterium]
MRSRARVAGHAIHPMLVTFPVGLLSTAVIFDVLRLVTNRQSFATTAAHMLAAGIIGGLVAAVFGLADWTKIPTGTRARRIGLYHATGNVAVLVLFALSLLLRSRSGDWGPSGLAIALSFAGLAITGVSSWLGGELVERLGVGVDEEADVNAPSSLRSSPTRPAGAR